MNNSRRSNTALRKASSRAKLSTGSEMSLSAQWLSAPTLTGSNQSSTIPSLASTGNSTPLGSLRRMSQTVDQSDHFSRRGKSYLSAPEDDEPWGHFIDIAEADDEIVRHSRILSAKEMYYRHNQ